MSNEIQELLSDEITMFAVENMVQQAEMEGAGEVFFDGTFAIVADTKYKQLCILSRKISVLNNAQKKLSTVVPIIGFFI